MIEIAEELGVSKSTVSRAFDPSSNISNEVRNRILEYAKEKNYVLNRAASRLSMREINIGMLYPDMYSYATNEFIRGKYRFLPLRQVGHERRKTVVVSLGA